MLGFFISCFKMNCGLTNSLSLTVLLQAFMWQLDFAAAPPVLRDLEHLLKVDDRVVRYVILRRSPFKPLPNTYKVTKQAKRAVQSTSL